MGRPRSQKPPTMTLHKPSGQARVRIGGKDFYLGKWNSPEAKQAYARVCAEWAAGRQNIERRPRHAISVNELALAYVQHADEFYRRDGEPTGEIDNIRAAVKILREAYGTIPVNEFGPLKLRGVVDLMIERKLSRGYINSQMKRIRRLFKWGVAEELVKPETHTALCAVTGLRKGRSKARETKPIGPVAVDVVNRTIKHLPQQVRDMVRAQLLLGCRPVEICQMRPGDVDMSGDVWLYVPEKHKTEHHGRQRIIAIGPRAQAVLECYLQGEPEAQCFQDSDGEPFTTPSYRRAIHRAAKAAGVEKWGPNRLRHSAATDLRRRYGVEAARVVLGHSSAVTSEIYAERDLQQALKIMAEVGWPTRRLDRGQRPVVAGRWNRLFKYSILNTSFITTVSSEVLSSFCHCSGIGELRNVLRDCIVCRNPLNDISKTDFAASVTRQKIPEACRKNMKLIMHSAASEYALSIIS